MPLKGDASELREIIRRGVAGLDADGNRYARPVINAVYQLTKILDQADIDGIEAAIEGVTLFTVIDAFIELVDAVNAEYYTGDPEVDTVTLENIGDTLVYYNGETYGEYLARVAQGNRSVHQIITE